MNPPVVPSVNLTYYYYYEKWSFLMAKSTNEMTMFNSYVTISQTVYFYIKDYKGICM